ncbi:MAG: DEAD/DEAH box helicase [Candidatus Thorarchaeota archaeon]
MEIETLQEKLKVLSNRYAIRILQVLSPREGGVVRSWGWDDLANGILQLQGYSQPNTAYEEKTEVQAQYEKRKAKITSGGTLYETMAKLVEEGLVLEEGERRKKNRAFRITREGRMTLSALQAMEGSLGATTELQKTAERLLKHKNFLGLLPGQRQFLVEVKDLSGNMVIQMGSGAGKTFLAIILLLSRIRDGAKCVYLAPYTSLLRQILDEYGMLFEQLGIDVARLDGTTRPTHQQLKKADLVVAIYESFLSAMMANRAWTKSIDLAVIDELTELDGGNRSLRARYLGNARSTRLDCLIAILKEQANLVTLSARFGGTQKVAEWLDAAVFHPDRVVRPEEFIVSREDNILSIESSDNSQQWEVKCQENIDGIIDYIGEYKDKSILIVVGSRGRTENIARRLANRYPREIESETVDMIVGKEGNMPIVQRLNRNLRKGVAFHHAGLASDIRWRLERSIKEREIRTIVSTTGITAGMSFPIDIIIIVFDKSTSYIASRPQYLQIAGRIGEYHLVEKGGAVYLIHEEPTRELEDHESLRSKLLLSPLELIEPSEMYPSLMLGLIAMIAMNLQQFTIQDIRHEFVQLVQRTLKHFLNESYLNTMEQRFDILFDWLLNQEILSKSENTIALVDEAKKAIESGMYLIDYVLLRDKIMNLSEKSTLDDLTSVLLRFNLVQFLRPTTRFPEKIELKTMGLEEPSDWYADLVEMRSRVKRKAILDWSNELKMPTIIENSHNLAQEIKIGGKPAAGSGLAEGDLIRLVGVCSNLAGGMSRFLRAIGRVNSAEQMEMCSVRLRYGVKPDLARTDLFELEIPRGTEARTLTREEARILYNREYKSIHDLVFKDIDRKKEGYARERFAQNCGLDEDEGVKIYKAALKYVRRQNE